MKDKAEELKKLEREKIFIYFAIGFTIMILYLRIVLLAILYPANPITLIMFFLVVGIMSVIIIDLTIKVEKFRRMSIEKYNDWLYKYIINNHLANAFILIGFFGIILLIYLAFYISILSIILFTITTLIFYKIHGPIMKRLEKTRWISKKFENYDYKFFMVPIESEFIKNKNYFQKDIIEKINPLSSSIYNVKYDLPNGVKVTLFTPQNITSSKENYTYCWVNIGVEDSDFENIFNKYRKLIDDIFDKNNYNSS